MDQLGEITLSRSDRIRDVIQRLGTVGVVLVVDGGRLEATLTDGDVRRALLAGSSLDSPISAVVEDRAVHPRGKPVTCPEAADPQELLGVMSREGIRHVVIIDEAGHPIRVVTLDDLVGTLRRRVAAVIFAGGEGRRLRPLTEQTPKPMLPIAGRPLLEHIVERLVSSGIREITIAVRYLAPVITEYFGEGTRFGASISYTREDMPLGTGGALSLMPRPSVPTLVINGDILTDVSFDGLVRFHNEQAASITLAVRRVDMQPPYGVVDTIGTAVSGIRERPLMHHFMNAGMYLLSPEVWDLIQPNSAFDMPSLVQRAIESRFRVVAFPVGEDWIDIGDHAAYSSVVSGPAS